jgi:transposase
MENIERVAVGSPGTHCQKCGGSGWLWCDELHNRAGHDPTALVVDDTKYDCDDCDGGRVKPCKCGQPARYFGEALMGSVSCTACDEFVMGVDVPDIRDRWNRGERGHVDG